MKSNQERSIWKWDTVICMIFVKQSFNIRKGSAHRRISAMRLMTEIPEIKPMIESGAVSLSGAASIQGFCNNQKKNEKPIALADKIKLVENIQHKTTRQVESMLLALDPESVTKDRERLVTPELTEIKITVDQTTMQQIADLKNWLSHAMPFASTKDILVKAIQELAERKNPTKPIQKNESAKTGAAITTAVRSRQYNGPNKISNQPNVGSIKSAKQFINSKNPVVTKVSSSMSRSIPAEIKRLVWHIYQPQDIFMGNLLSEYKRLFVYSSQEDKQFSQVFWIMTKWRK